MLLRVSMRAFAGIVTPLQDVKKINRLIVPVYRERLGA